MDTVVKVDSLSKAYGATIAVDEISFEVHQGEIFGMVGPNGAGKTTTIECLEGLRKPDHGQISILGIDPQHESHYLHLHTGMQLQQSNLPERMKVWEALDLYSSFYTEATDWRQLLIELGLEEKRNTAFVKLSGGQKQRLFIALALLPNPELIFLDELTTGLDPQARHAIWDLVRRVQEQGKTILLTTHYMEEAERLCDRVAIIDHGRIVALDAPAELVRMYGSGEVISFTVDSPLPANLLDELVKIGHIDQEGETIVVRGDGNQASLVSEVVLLLTGQAVKFRNMRSEGANLEDVFLQLTGREMKE